MGSCTLSLWVIVVVIARSFLCLQQQPGSLLGFAPSWARAHLQHTMLSPNITLESCRCSAFVFIEKQILGMVKAMSSKHTVLERDVLEVPFPVRNCKSGGRKRHWKTAGKRGGKCILRKWWKSPQCAKLQSLVSGETNKLTSPRNCRICTRPRAHISVNRDLFASTRAMAAVCKQSLHDDAHISQKKACSEKLSKIWPQSH